MNRSLLSNGVVVPAGADVQQEFPVSLGGATELKPGDLLIAAEAVVIEANDTEVMFQASCSYGNAAKLKSVLWQSERTDGIYDRLFGNVKG